MTSVTQGIIKIMPPGIQAPISLILHTRPMFRSRSLTFRATRFRSRRCSINRLNSSGSSCSRPRGPIIARPRMADAARAIMVNIDPAALYAKRVSPAEPSATRVNNTNIILPAGTIKIGDREYFVELNGSPNSHQGIQTSFRSRWRGRLRSFLAMSHRFTIRTRCRPTCAA